MFFNNYELNGFKKIATIDLDGENFFWGGREGYMDMGRELENADQKDLHVIIEYRYELTVAAKSGMLGSIK